MILTINRRGEAVPTAERPHRQRRRLSVAPVAVQEQDQRHGSERSTPAGRSSDAGEACRIRSDGWGDGEADPGRRGEERPIAAEEHRLGVGTADSERRRSSASEVLLACTTE